MRASVTAILLIALIAFNNSIPGLPGMAECGHENQGRIKSIPEPIHRDILAINNLRPVI